ncbi:MAG: DNA cytosine methyltransferase [Eubacterium ventriosum]
MLMSLMIITTDTFECNYDIKVDRRDIHDVKVEDIPDFDIMLAGFPCQAFFYSWI